MKNLFIGTRMILLLLMCILIIPISSQAGSGYFTFGQGAYFPQSNTLKDSNPGYSADFAGGYFFNPNFAGELDIGYYNTYVPIYLTYGTKTKMPIAVMPITLNLVAASARTGDLKTYIKAGGGLYYIEYSPPLSDYKSEAIYGYQLGFGAIYKYIGIEAKYIIAKESESKIFPNDKVKVEFNGFVVTLVISNF